VTLIAVNVKDPKTQATNKGVRPSDMETLEWKAGSQVCLFVLSTLEYLYNLFKMLF